MFMSMIYGTPMWVWGLLAVVTVLGIRALKPMSATPGRIAILPAAFLAWGLQSILTKFAITPLGISAWIGGIALGTVAGLLLTAALKVSADRSTGLITVPGSAVTLVVSLLIFASKYAFTYVAIRYPAVGRDALFIVCNLASSGLFTGILVGRFLGLLRVYRNTPASPQLSTI